MSDDEGRLRAAALRGARAKAILDDPMFKEAIQTMKDAALRDLIGVPLTGKYDGEADQLRIVAQVKVMLTEQFLNVFAAALQDGKIGVWELNARTDAAR